jgi:hypothetical protein
MGKPNPTIPAKKKGILSRLAGLFHSAPDGVIILRDGDSCLVIVKDGQVLFHTSDVALSHAEFVRRTSGTLPEGAWVGTIRKFGGEVVALSSRTFYGNQLPAPPPVAEAIHAAFR